MANQSRDNLMLRAVWMYYHDNLTHAEIAAKLRTSRVKITRLLQKARDEGIVEIRILKPLPVTYELAQRIEQTYGIDEVIVAQSGVSLAESVEAVGQKAAHYLMETIGKDCIVGFGWSSTVSRMAPYLETPDKPVTCTIVDLAGSMLGQANPYSVSGRVAEIFDAPLLPLSVPVIVANKSTREAFLSEPSIQAALKMARASTMAFVGLGDAGPEGTMVSLGYLTPEEMSDVRARGAVGEILMRYFNSAGEPIATPLDDHVIALGWEELKRIPRLVIVAAGPRKVEPIRGILRSGLGNCLITDTNTAEMILEEVQERA